MRRYLFALCVLSACQMTAPGNGANTSVSPLDTAAIATTTLDAPAVPVAPAATLSSPATTAAIVAAGPNTPRPKPHPTAPSDAAKAAAPRPEVTVVPVSPQQLSCEKSGAQWATAGDSGANLCVRRTRDGGKSCSKKSDCSGQCLARSETCSPIEPMIGCNDVLDSDGRMVTLCLN